MPPLPPPAAACRRRRCVSHTPPLLLAQAVGDVCMGSVMGPSSQRANECRIAMFLAGFPESVPVHTVNRQCSSGACVCVWWVLEDAWWMLQASRRQHGARGQAHAAGAPRHMPAAAERVDSRLPPAGLQAIADVAASIRAGYYTIGIAGGVRGCGAGAAASPRGPLPRPPVCSRCCAESAAIAR